jgi:hypothetical protein
MSARCSRLYHKGAVDVLRRGIVGIGGFGGGRVAILIGVPAAEAEADERIGAPRHVASRPGETVASQRSSGLCIATTFKSLHHWRISAVSKYVILSPQHSLTACDYGAVVQGAFGPSCLRFHAAFASQRHLVSLLH